MSRTERFAVAVFVAALHRQPAAETFYADQLAHAGGDVLRPALTAAAASGHAEGPTGHYPAGPLSREDTDAPAFTADAATLGPRLAAALAHAHMLVFHPRDAGRAHLTALLDAGWTTTGIVTLSQLVAFLAFQLRVAHGLATLAAAPAPERAPT